MTVRDLPLLNATLNAAATIFLCLGWIAIRSGRKRFHIRMMIGALIASTLFLASYLYYHFNVGAVTRFEGEGIARAFYFLILFTHIPLAIGILPFIFASVWFGARGEFARHTNITRRLLPVWLYVSVTGVLIYVMLYVL